MGPSPVALADEATTCCGRLRSRLQQQLRVVDGNPELRRIAQVVAWLEELAASDLGCAAGPGTRGPSVLAGRFGAGQNLWRDTAAQLKRHFHNEHLVEALDPDATTWCARASARPVAGRHSSPRFAVGSTTSKTVGLVALRFKRSARASPGRCVARSVVRQRTLAGD